jgi:hypothetical protein
MYFFILLFYKYRYYSFWLISLLFFVAFQGISSLIEDFVMRHQDLIFYNLRPSVVDIFQGVQPKQFKHCQTEEQLHDCLKGERRIIKILINPLRTGFIYLFYYFFLKIFNEPIKILN